MKRATTRFHTPPQSRIRLRRIRRSCLYREPHRRAPTPQPGTHADVLRKDCRYTLQTTPPLFRRRR